MMYCPIIHDYVDQDEKCINCEHYKKIEDSCIHPEPEEE